LVVAIHKTPGAGAPGAPATPRKQPGLTASLPLPPFVFPGGKRQLSGVYRFVALYGSPDTPALGALGDQPLSAAADRIQAIAKEYQPYSAEPIYPSFEIITTVASGSPTDNGDYSQEVDPAVILPWVQTARARGIYVVLDLQSGRTDFLTQAKEYQALLEQPNVGLALDPEWRLMPDQVPLKQIGSVSIDEVNGVSTWLANLISTHKLPQKLFVLHQFRLDMLPGRERLNTNWSQLAYIVQMDGQGTQVAKQDTWHSITASPPPHVVFGWKNFYTQDSPMLDIANTMRLQPRPWYISYQ